jgi:regulator of replication initiation timing
MAKKQEYGADFSADVKINRFQLDKECEIHPSLYQYYSDLLSEARTAKDRAEAALSLVKAEVELAIRGCPPEGIKVTETSIKAMVEANEDVQGAGKKLRRKKTEIYTFESAVTSLEHRKRMLDNLTQLWSKGYYAKPGEFVGDRSNKEAEKSVRNRLNHKDTE